MHAEIKRDYPTTQLINVAETNSVAAGDAFAAPVVQILLNTTNWISLSTWGNNARLLLIATCWHNAPSGRVSAQKGT